MNKLVIYKKSLILLSLNILLLVTIEANKDNDSPINIKSNKLNQNTKSVMIKPKYKKKSLKNLLHDAYDLIVNNFHTVERGVCYRCRQPSARDFKRYVRKYGIKTVINLRGLKKNTEWFAQEEDTLKKLGVTLINIGIKAEVLPSKESVEKILEAFDTCEKPVLIHCKRGADRTGFVSALWMMYKMNKSKKEALSQLSVKYLHFSYFLPNMKKFVNMWQGKDWLETTYQA